MKFNGVKIGVGVIIQRSNGDILIGKRKNSVAPYYSIPGGGLELGETFEEGAMREVQEETGIVLKNPKVICVTNNLGTFHNEGIHFVSIGLYERVSDVEPILQEPDKCEEWFWADPKNLPEPHFEASTKCIEAFMGSFFYKRTLVDQD